MARPPDEGAERARLQDYSPMLATPGAIETLSPNDYAFEGSSTATACWSRSVVRGRVRMQSRSGRDVTGEYPQLHSLAADFDHHAILDGEVVALDADGVPKFGEMQNRSRTSRIEFWAFDVLRLDGRSLLKAKYRDRRRILEALASDLIVPELLSVMVRRCWRAHAGKGGRGSSQRSGTHPSAGTPFIVVDQVQDLEHPGSGSRWLAGGGGSRAGKSVVRSRDPGGGRAGSVGRWGPVSPIGSW